MATRIRIAMRLSEDSMKRVTDEWKNRSFPTPPSSVRGKKRKHASEHEDEEVDDDVDQRLSTEGKYYTRKLLIFFSCSLLMPRSDALGNTG
jgi:hypothetical protein